MNFEEKRELRLQISQLLADAGLNQGTIKEMVQKEIKNKVDRALDQTIKKLNAECSSGDYFDETIRKMLRNTYLSQSIFHDAVKNELKNKVIEIKLKDVVNQ